MATPLKEIRETRGLSQDDLAKLAGVGRNTVGGLEAGRQKPRPSTRRKLASALKVKPQDIDFETMGHRPAVVG